MSLRALVYAYVLGGLTFVPLLLVCITLCTSRPHSPAPPPPPPPEEPPTDDGPRTRKGWLTVRRAFHDAPADASYVTLVRSYLDARSKDPKRSRPKDAWYVVLKGTVLYLYEDEAMTECEAAIELGGHDVVVYPEGLHDGELFARRNAICLKPRCEPASENKAEQDEPREQALPWFIFVRCCVDMEDWYLALVHASDSPSGTSTLNPLRPVFLPSEMNALVATLDEQPDVIPMRWFNALLGRVFYSFYRTEVLESYIINRLMKKLSKVKRPAFLTDVAVTQFSVGNRAPTFSKPMLKELTKEGDASLELGLFYKGEIRATVEATAVINLGARFKSYTVKLVLAVVLRELEGNLLVKVKRPPSSRIWYAFTKPPRMVINVEPIVSDRQITWSMILNTIEAKIEEIITESVVLPHMDDISFFDSADYEHRGGIWADAVRLDTPAPDPITKLSPPADGSQPSEEAGVIRVEVETFDSFPTSSEKPSVAARRRSWFYSSGDIELDGHVEEEARGGEEPSTSSPATSVVPPRLDAPDDDQDGHEHLKPRSSSVHSQERQRTSRTPSLSSSVGGDEYSNYLSDTSATSKSPRQSFGASTTSFLSTLKSKAGDKQALSNTAKEAMRKWGVNWGLKKENGRNHYPDDLADMPSDHRARTESARNYVDMHTAGLERREREIDGSTSPILIPGGEKARSSSASGSRVTMHVNGSTSTGLSRSFGDVPSDAFKDRDLPQVTDENAPSLIHTQPSEARTMTIPGIHASHRGEVMSMGNVAPESPAPETKPKGATMQSMYRLWKSPILTGQPSEGGSLNGSASPRLDADDGNQDITPLTLTPEAVPPPRAVPPPLPPRTISSVAVRHGTEGESPLAVGSVSAASQALKTIACRDETRRLSVEVKVPVDGEPTLSMGPEVSATPNPRPDGKPPLPPRRLGA